MINITKLYCGLASLSDPLRFPPQRDTKPIVVFNCTPRCNLRCIHCYSDSDIAVSQPILTTDQAKMLIDQIGEFGCPALLFSGGEPLLRPDLLDLLAYAHKRAQRTVLSTNGTLITPAVAAKLAEAGVSYVGISLDGIQSYHDAFRQTDGAFAAALAGFRHCREVGIRCGLRLTMTAQNISQISDIFRLAADHQIRRLCFYHLIRTGRAEQLANQMPSTDQTRQAIDTILDCSVRAVHDKTVDEVLTVGNHADGVYILLKLRQQKHPQAKTAEMLLRRAGGNRVGQNIAAVNWNGDVFADQFWRNYAIGNILRQPFGKIWQNDADPVLNILRHKKYYKDPKCSRCAWFELCLGNFRSLTGKPILSDCRNEPPCYLTEQEIAG